MRLMTLALCTVAAPAFAQDEPAGTAFEFGLGVETAPGYFGAAEGEGGIGAYFSLDYFNYGSVGIGGEEQKGFGFGGSGRFIPARKADDYAELAGLEDIDAALEVGAALSYKWDNADVFANVRRGFGGHDGYVAEVGGDLVVAASRDLTLRVGPRLMAGDEVFADTYFGVSATESAVSGFNAFQAGEGILSRGVEFSADYDFNTDWGMIGTVRYDEWLNDAAASPIVQQGSDDSLTASFVLTRNVSFSF